MNVVGRSVQAIRSWGAGESEPGHPGQFTATRRILGETDGALDVLQSVWLTMHRRLWKRRSATAFRVWVYRIAHDQAVSELRRKVRRSVLLEDIPTGPPTAA